MLILLLAVAGGAWLFLGPGTGFSDDRKVLYIPAHGASRQGVLDSLAKNGLVRHTGLFAILADRLGYWDRIRPGRYEIRKGESLLTLVRRLRNGVQSPVSLVINKVRTTSDLARLIGRKIEADSAEVMAYLQDPQMLDSAGLTEATIMTRVIPDTYSVLWTASPASVFAKLSAEAEAFWTADRKALAAALGLKPEQAYTLASIVEEETNDAEEKDTVASVYLNRLRTGMPLQADPTVRFALQDFTITRIFGAHLQVASPYNTYRNSGLPPGPICTPSRQTLEAVLQPAQTDYLYFVADSRFNGTHDFSATYDEHLRKARAYQAAYRERFGKKPAP